jgi:hypothetical protein
MTWTEAVIYSFIIGATLGVINDMFRRASK